MTEDDLYARLSEAAEAHEESDSRPTTVICEFRIADFDRWQAGYERAIAADPKIVGYRIWRGQDDANRVVIVELHDSRSHAQAMFDHPATREAMERDGIDMSSIRWEYLDEVGAWSR